MIEFFEKEDFTQEDIQSFIDNELEESIHLDFKSAAALDKSDLKKKELSKDISAFANSDGGLIIYGIDEKDHKASSISFVNGKIYTKEWLEQLINTTIQRRIPELIIYPVRFDSKIEQTVYVVKIPKSHNTPHIAKDKRFYKRYNFETVMMEEYEIRELYGRKSKSLLVIADYSIYRINSGSSLYEEGYFKFQFVVSIANDGDRPEPEYKVNLYFVEHIADIRFSWNSLENKYQTTRYGNKRIKISSVESPTIYPTEMVDVVKVDVEIPIGLEKNVLNELEFEIRLFYSNGEDRMEGDFKNFINDSKSK